MPAPISAFTSSSMYGELQRSGCSTTPSRELIIHAVMVGIETSSVWLARLVGASHEGYEPVGPVSTPSGWGRGHEDAEGMAGRVGVDPERLLRVVGGGLGRLGAEGEGPVVLGVEVGLGRDREVEVELLGDRALRPGGPGEGGDRLEGDLELSRRGAEHRPGRGRGAWGGVGRVGAVSAVVPPGRGAPASARPAGLGGRWGEVRALAGSGSRGADG